MEELNQRIAYLQGLTDGLATDEMPSKESLVLEQVVDVLYDISEIMDDMMEDQMDLEEYVSFVDEDLSVIEDEIFYIEDEESCSEHHEHIGCCEEIEEE